MKKLIVLLAFLGLLLGMGVSPASAAVGTVTANGQSTALTGVNIYRAANTLVQFTPAFGASTGANQYGAEVAVVGGVVTKVENGIGNMAIPSGGYVLSGHGTARTWLLANAKVGAAVTINTGTPPPPPTAASSVTVGGNTLALTGTDVARTKDALIRYTPAKGATTGTNQYGFEAAVVGGKVTVIQNAVGNMAIPSNGFVLSGHGTAKTWLQANAKVGVTVVLNTSGGGTAPAPVKETRTIDGTVDCTTLTVETLTQERTNTWKWDGTAWVANWSAWTTTSTGTRAAKAADCLEPGTVPTDALLPDIRIKNLNKCGAGDLAATNNTCFKIYYPTNAEVADFPALIGKKLLKFPVITMNVGDGPAEMLASRTSSTATDWKAYQNIARPNGEKVAIKVDGVNFSYAGDGHEHWHIEYFDDYWIESLDGVKLKYAAKKGYCLWDNTSYGPFKGLAGVPAAAVYTYENTCGQGLEGTLDFIEGLSRGWGDTYPSSLPDQAIDITGLANGRYRVGVTADDVNSLIETNDTNNTATMEVTISGNTVTTHPETATGGLN